MTAPEPKRPTTAELLAESAAMIGAAKPNAPGPPSNAVAAKAAYQAQLHEKLYYSPSRRGFFSSRLHAKVGLPEDAIEITRAEHVALISSGREIVPGPDGRPMVSNRVASAEEKAGWLRASRDAALRASDGLVARHRDQIEAAVATSMTADEYQALQRYRQALRDLPKAPGFPDIGLPPSPVAGEH